MQLMLIITSLQYTLQNVNGKRFIPKYHASNKTITFQPTHKISIIKPPIHQFKTKKKQSKNSRKKTASPEDVYISNIEHYNICAIVSSRYQHANVKIHNHTKQTQRITIRRNQRKQPNNKTTKQSIKSTKQQPKFYKNMCYVNHIKNSFFV